MYRGTANRKKSNPVWIPYGLLLGEVLPAEKGTDMRIEQRLLSLLNVIPLAKIDSRQKLVNGSEEMVIANLEDLAEVLHITQNTSGIPSYKIKFYKDIFLPLLQSKTKPDEKDGKEEKTIGVTTKELADYYKDTTGKAISTDNLRKTILVELLNNDYLGELKSELDNRQFIYYSLMEFEDSERMKINLTRESQENPDITKMSNSESFRELFTCFSYKTSKKLQKYSKRLVSLSNIGTCKISN